VALESRRLKAHTGIMDKTPPKIVQLVADAKAELKRLGIDIEGKRSDELLNMARQERNHARAARPKPQ
jgi:hypothetical protein